MEAITAFIPAAGLGERLKPITDQIPKPLLPILGEPVIETVLNRISRLSPNAIAVNMHHHWEQIQSWAATSKYAPLISLFHENPILGTGGAIKNAYSSMTKSAFIVHNADIISDIDLSSLVDKHIESGNIATLAVHDENKFNNVWIDRKGNLRHVGGQIQGTEEVLCKIAFMGIALYSPEFLDFLPIGPSSVIDAWLRATAAGKTIGTVDFSGTFWTDIGTPNAYAVAVFESLRRQGKTVYAHASANCDRAELQGCVVIEQGGSVGSDAFVSNCILLAGAHVASGSRIENSILGRGFRVAIDTAGIPENTIPLYAPLLKMCGYSDGRVNAVRIGAGGSDRTYYRVPCRETTYVLMSCAESDADYERHLVLSDFLRSHGVPVPAMLAADKEKKQALFEDLGDLSLYSWLACRRRPNHIKSLYGKILDILVALHTSVTDHAAECKQLHERCFDREHLRWESRYFMENFIGNILQMHAAVQGLLDKDFESLAAAVAAFDRVILHRDFQSQNIMVVHGDEPRLIDFQGARMGPAAYDIASLLWDPYYCLQDSTREALLAHYIMRRKKYQKDFDEHTFRETLLPCRLQRHMQALGAYGFLARLKGKKYFLRHIPQALAYLKQESLEACETYPALHHLIETLHEEAAY